MRLLSVAILTAVGIFGWTGQGSARDGVAGRIAAPTTCGDHGTNLHFEKSPSDAARKALKEEKLVFVLHISGHFEDSDYT